jgi:hypothetical protein
MNRYLRIGLVAAGAFVAVLIGIQLFGGPNVDSGLDPTLEPSPTSTPQSSPSGAENVLSVAGELAGGRHSAIAHGVRFSFGVATSGWYSQPAATSGWIYKGMPGAETPQDEAIAWVPFWGRIDYVYGDPCAHTEADPPIGPTAADLANALSTLPGTNLVSGPSDVTVAGLPAKHVVITIREDIACAAEDFWLWGNTDHGSRYASGLGNTIRVWIVEVEGARFMVESEALDGARPSLEREIDQIIDSIQFEQ